MTTTTKKAATGIEEEGRRGNGQLHPALRWWGRRDPRNPSRFVPPAAFSQGMPSAPAPTTLMEKWSHSLPLLLHLVLVGMTCSWAVVTAFMAHVLDGPLKPSWNLLTTIAHAAIKSFMGAHAPQGYHSMAVVRFVAGLSIPAAVTGASITADDVEVLEDQRLADAVRRIVGLPDAKSVFPGRRVGAEWVMHSDVVDTNEALNEGSSSSSSSRKVVLYLHGGAHIFLSPRTHRGITAHISRASNCPVFALDYRLAPESSFPCAIEDAIAAYLSLLDPACIPSTSALGNPATRPVARLVPTSPAASTRARLLGTHGLHPSQIVVAGDSSGGCLSMQLLLTLQALGLPLPGAAVLLSPYVDNERKADSWRRNWNSDFLSLDPRGMDWANRCVAGSDAIPNAHPIFSPIHADLTGMCPLLIQAGEAEVLTDDAIRLHANAVAAGGWSQLQLYTDSFHVFHAFPSIPSSTEAIKRIGDFIQNLPTPTTLTTPTRPISPTPSLDSGPLPTSPRRRRSKKNKKKSNTPTILTPPPAPASDDDAASTASSKAALPPNYDGEVAVLITCRARPSRGWAEWLAGAVVPVGVTVEEEEIPTTRVAEWRFVEVRPTVASVM
ncbi:hypothetical protein HDU96_010999 [Phlyctochytrium bullatum]|nr:hypothetical protein HDU96_010999 [Phlyctochytrium bullatum]